MPEAYNPDTYERDLKGLSEDLKTLQNLYPDTMKPLFERLQGVVFTTFEAHYNQKHRNHNYVQPSLLDHISEDGEAR